MNKKLIFKARNYKHNANREYFERQSEKYKSYIRAFTEALETGNVEILDQAKSDYVNGCMFDADKEQAFMDFYHTGIRA